MSILKLFNIVPKKFTNKLYIFLFFNFFTCLFEMISLGIVFPLVLTMFSNNIPDLKIISDLNFYLFNNELSYAKTIEFFLIIFLSSFVIKNFFLIYFKWWQYNLNNLITLDIQNSIYKVYINEKIQNINNYNTGVKIRNIKTETSRFGKFFISLMSLITEAFIIVGILIILLITNYLFSIVIIIISLVVILFFYFIAKKIAVPISEKKLALSEKSMSILNESLKFIKEIRIFKKTNLFLDRFYTLEKKGFDLTTKFQTYNASPKLIIETLVIIILASTIFLFDVQKIDNAEITALLSLIIVSAIRIYPSISKILISLNEVKHTQPVLTMLIKELNKETIISKKNTSDHNFKKNIIFNNTSFSYENSKIIIEDCNLRINQKDKILILAPSGTGKTTFLDLITGLIKPTEGKIQLDDYDTNEYFESLNHNFGYLSQESFILNDSIKFNITFEKNDREIDLKQLKDAIEISGLKQINENIEELLNTEINENGSNISGGQRQRISLARLIYKNPLILLLDEPTSQLDKESEKLIIKKLLNYFENKTIIFTTHSKEISKFFNKKYVLKNHKMIEYNEQ